MQAAGAVDARALREGAPPKRGGTPGPAGTPPAGQPWFARKRVLWPLLFVLSAAATIAALWCRVPVLNEITGEQETQGTQIVRFTQNLIRPQTSLSVAFGGQQQVRVLLVGLDHVPEKHGEAPTHRSDSVMLAAVDFDTKQIRVLSIPRDGWVEQYRDGVDKGRDKLAHSYVYGGIEQTKETVEQLLGLPAECYVTIKFEGLAGLVDKLGGLQVDVEKDMDYDDNWGRLHIHLKHGPQWLSGEQVVQYARFRHDTTGDIARMARQQKVLQLLMAELMRPENFGRLPGIAKVISECVETNLTWDQLLALAQHAREFRPEGIRTFTLNSFCNMGPGAVSEPGVPGDMSVQVILDKDIADARAFLAGLVGPPPAAPESAAAESGQQPEAVNP
jgi:LCP family protein required for cell wall assembly